MDSVRIALIEDNPSDMHNLADCLTRYFNHISQYFDLRLFSDSSQFLADSSMFQLIFMDIELPGMNGIETSRLLREKGSEAVIVLVTNNVQYALHGYSVRAADYMVKPVTYEQMLLKMPEFLALIRRKQKYITIRKKQEIIKIGIQMVRYIEIYGHNLIFHLLDRSEECTGTLKEYEEELNKEGFSRCSQSTLVNLAFVDSITQDTVKMGPDLLTLSRRERKRFLTDFTDFIGG